MTNDQTPNALSPTLATVMKRLGDFERQFQTIDGLEDKMQGWIHDLRGFITQQSLNTQIEIKKQQQSMDALFQNQTALLEAVKALTSSLETMRGALATRDTTLKQHGEALLALQERVARVEHRHNQGDQRMDNLERDMQDIVLRLAPMTTYFFGDDTRPSFTKTRETELKQLSELTALTARVQTQVDLIVSDQAERVQRHKARREAFSAGARAFFQFAQTRFGWSLIVTIVITLTQWSGLIQWAPIGELVKHLVQLFSGGS